MRNIQYAYQNHVIIIFRRNQHFYITNKDVMTLFELTQEELNHLVSEIEEKKEMVKPFYYQKGETIFYNLTFVFLMGLEIDKDFVKDFYCFCKKKNYLKEISPYYIGEIEEVLIRFRFNEVVMNYQEFMATLKKVHALEEDDLHPLYLYDTFDVDAINRLIERVKKALQLSDDFGKEKEGCSFAYILNQMDLDSEMVANSLEEKASAYFYTLIKEKPFIEGNEEIACLVALYYLNANQILFANETMMIHPSDFAYALSYVEDASLSKKEVIAKIKYLFAQNPNPNNDVLKERLSLLKRDNSYENVIHYVVAFIEAYHGYQGYYDYYQGEYCVYKLHYHGEYRYFKLNIAQTMALENTLCFDVLATAFMEAPTSLENRDKVIESLYHEIQYRSYHDVIQEDLMKALAQQIKSYYDFRRIHLKFNIKWKFEVESDYEF